ncbi:SagB/ThcOx family dehydrogenase [Fuchsiella alkaliacetigena]|uniref:SagB/ThcOx family dehydrogenase n=1 Tax=Fuchsiella alkaliacetigena TaxID=957042 RepID=UPI00200B3BE1|nr:SagB/ThcOx family dehydrogenase [Fuchsiella alkaliacetigena]MCK8824039.1 SagB/ThcOx family dehydrogenase [Fuchsiella alkaliacetigena]
MKRYRFLLIILLLIIPALLLSFKLEIFNSRNADALVDNSESIELPAPQTDSQISIEKALSKRRSIREYTEESLSLKEVSQLLWAGQGITDQQRKFRTAPSAGALYPLEVYLVVEGVKELSAGIYHYQPAEHQLVKLSSEANKEEIYNAALNQEPIIDAPVNIIITAVYERTKARYGTRGERYAKIEVGHAAQNIYLQSTALDLGTVIIGAFDESRIAEILQLPDNKKPLAIMPVGKK